ncbi:signal peptidase I, partial [Limosilactobacillus fermentum]|nr:signal peptidase I [Limosilactobacillus fermentum]
MKALRQTLSWLIPVAIGLIIALLVKQFSFQLVKVDGPSMQPNLQNNEWVVAVKTSKIHRGSVIVFDANGVDPQ